MIPFIRPEDEAFAQKLLQDFYDKGRIPPEKKPYLTDLRHSEGPYLGVETAEGAPPRFILDAASQIASLGLGFNPLAFFAPAHHIESWVGRGDTPEVAQIRRALDRFLARQLGADEIFTTLCHSGAEANEIALGYCYQRRRHLQARRVLGFEGSFHGRMLVSLFATWSPAKREPFQWPGYEAWFLPYPFLEDDYGNHLDRPCPEDWIPQWHLAAGDGWAPPTSWSKGKGPQMAKEIAILLQVKEKLATREVFAVLIEPMQCEGGDRYSSHRFQWALLALAQGFGIPVVYDEIQTGFHLGREFFWHCHPNVIEGKGEQLRPNYITCAKKGQLGVAISFEREDKTVRVWEKESFNVSSLIRGLAHGHILGQFKERILELERNVKKHLHLLMETFKDFIERPRAFGLAFAFDCKDPVAITQCVVHRFKYGLLFYPAGDRTLRFRLNTSFGKDELDVLFRQLKGLCGEVFLGRPPGSGPQTQTLKKGGRPGDIYPWQELFLKNNLLSLQGKAPDEKEVFKAVEDLVAKEMGQSQSKANAKANAKAKLILIDGENFSRFKKAIENLEKRIYEPARQTDIDAFERSANAPDPLCLGFVREEAKEEEKEEEVMGIAFCAPLKTFPRERCVRSDPHFENPRCLYMLDVTVDEKYQGQGLGRLLKYSLFALAQAKGYERLQGKNRDQLAKGMLHINLSLGAYEQEYVREYYLDDEDSGENSRDALLYTSPLQWKCPPSLNLGQAISSPLGPRDLSLDFCREQLPYLVNKMTLSNFVNPSFLQIIDKLFSLLPRPLQQGYCASGPSECVDKIAKSLWLKFKSKSKSKSKRLKHSKGTAPTLSLTFEGHFFGIGSFLSRTLSGEGEAYFPVEHLPHPTRDNGKELLSLLEKHLQGGQVFGVWIEPLPQESMERVPRDFLSKLRGLCTRYQTPLVYNETASAFYRYGEDHFCCGGGGGGKGGNSETETETEADLTPDAMMLYLGGQGAVVGLSRDSFEDKPLAMISTWDGDQFSLAQACWAIEKIEENPKAYFKKRRQFQKSWRENSSPSAKM